VILVFSDAGDPSARAITELIREEGVACRWLDLDRFPERDCLRYSVAPGGPPRRSFQWDGEWIDLEGVRSILWRRPARVQAPADGVEEDVRDHVSATLREAVNGVFEDLDCLQVPAPRHVSLGAHMKIPQLTTAARLGFTLPPTLITNAPEEFLSFYREHEGQVIVKPVGVYAPDFLRGVKLGYARPIRPRELTFVQDVQLCPFIAQVYVDKRVEVRVTVVGFDVFAVEIHSQVARRTRVDWRHYDLERTPHHPHPLPDDVADRCVRLVR
jgi:hypothetical protein